MPVHGFVQTRAHTNYDINTMQYWIPSAWTPVPSGLASNKGYKDIVKRGQDTRDTLALILVFGHQPKKHGKSGEETEERCKSYAHNFLTCITLRF
jgi:hypothetical protein